MNKIIREGDPNCEHSGYTMDTYPGFFSCRKCDYLEEFTLLTLQDQALLDEVARRNAEQ